MLAQQNEFYNGLEWKPGPVYHNVTDTATCVTKVLSYLSTGGLVFLYLKKAFELVRKTSILVTLARNEFKGQLLKWIRNYLVDRQASVKFQRHSASYKTFDRGTPKGRRGGESQAQNCIILLKNPKGGGDPKPNVVIRLFPLHTTTNDTN